MKRTALLLFLALATLTVGAAPHPEWLKDAVIYHIYPSSYMDSDGNGIGDLEGIRSRLDYIAGIGVNTIWLSPCFKSDWKDGGYDITDYYAVDPRFGTNDDLQRLLDEAHAKGLRVLLDLVAGHTSIRHPWFQASAGGEDGPYKDFYIWTDDKSEKPGKSFIDNDFPRGGYYLKNYFDIQPALNYGYLHPEKPWQQGYDDPGPRAVRDALKQIIAFWCDRGVDGFRVDMAPSLVKGDDKEKTGIKRFWNEMFTWYRAQYPECIMLSEWGEPADALAAGFDIDLLIHSPGKICGKIYNPLVHETDFDMAPRNAYFSKNGKGSAREPMRLYKKVLKTQARLGGYASLPTSSHDIWRLSRMNRTSPEEQKVVLTFFLTQAAPPVVYYGEEIGMKNLEYAPPKEGSLSRRNRSTSRTPMQWTSGVNAGFSTADPAALYLPVDNAPGFPNVADQEGDPASVLNYVRGLLALRREIPALGTAGDWVCENRGKQEYPLVYTREYKGDRYLVALNPTGEPVEFALPAIGKKTVRLYGTGTSATEYGKLILGPVSAGIFRLHGREDFRLEAHRGICNRYPENTVLAFREAAQIPVYAGIETDVQCSADGVLVLMHDKTLDRTTDTTGAVADYTFRQLTKKIHIDGGYGWENGRHAGRKDVRIPTFESYLKICNASGKIPYVELKLLDDEGVAQTIAMIHKMGFQDDEYILTSSTLHYLEVAGTLCKARREYMKKRFKPAELEELAAKDPTLIIRPASIHLKQEVVNKCRELGFEMEAYVLPVGNRALLEQLKDWGVQGATCNDWLGLGFDE